MNELVRDPAPRLVPTKFDRDPIRTAPVRAVTVWGNARQAGDDNTPRGRFGLRGKKGLNKNCFRLCDILETPEKNTVKHTSLPEDFIDGKSTLEQVLVITVSKCSMRHVAFPELIRQAVVMRILVIINPSLAGRKPRISPAFSKHNFKISLYKKTLYTEK